MVKPGKTMTFGQDYHYSRGKGYLDFEELPVIFSPVRFRIHSDELRAIFWYRISPEDRRAAETAAKGIRLIGELRSEIDLPAP